MNLAHHKFQFRHSAGTKNPGVRGRGIQENTVLKISNTTNTNGMEHQGTFADVSCTADRRAAAWLSSRLARGRKERFCEIVNLTPPMAEALLALNTNNRNALESRITQYADLMRQGKWRLTTEGIGVSTQDVIINGGHRLQAIMASGCTVPMTIWFGCDPDEFMVVDGGRARGADQLLAMRGYDHTALRASLAKMLMQMETSNRGIYSPQHVVAYAEAMDQARARNACHYGQMLGRVTSPTAACLAWWHIAKTSPNASRLPEFWKGLNSGEELSGPRLHLREWLFSGEFAGRSSNSVTVKRAAAFVLTWNAWLRGKKRATYTWSAFSHLPEAF